VIIKLIKVNDCAMNSRENSNIMFVCFRSYLDKIKDFLNEFEVDTDDGYKASKYVKQIVKEFLQEICFLFF